VGRKGIYACERNRAEFHKKGRGCIAATPYPNQLNPRSSNQGGDLQPLFFFKVTGRIWKFQGFFNFVSAHGSVVYANDATKPIDLVGLKALKTANTPP
jgi:hypothetical protein